MFKMSPIAWKPEYSIGIPSVDHEHQVLITEINNTIIECSIEQNSKSSLLDRLGELQSQISAHFALEENIMAARNYDELKPHKDDHERLLDDIGDLMGELESSDSLDLERFSQRLSNWFLGHFSTHDARLHKCLEVF